MREPTENTTTAETLPGTPASEPAAAAPAATPETETAAKGKGGRPPKSVKVKGGRGCTIIGTLTISAGAEMELTDAAEIALVKKWAPELIVKE